MGAQEGRRVAVCSAHLASGKTAEAEKERREQAMQLLETATRFASNSPLILGGDLNAEPLKSKGGEPLTYRAVMEHNLGVTSVYALLNDVRGVEPKYTTWKRRPK